MKLNELKKGEVYYCESNPNYFKNSIFIFKFDKAEKDNGTYIETLGILRTNKKEFDSKGLNDSHHYNLRLATLEEKIWLEQCKKAGKFVSKELALEQYEKEFKLPEKWCIKIKEEYKEDLNKYLHSNSDKYPGYKERWNLSTVTEKYFFYSETTPETEAHSSYEYYPEFTEITFKQFKQYVLKENTIEKWSKGTYVVFLKDNIQYNKYKKGEIQEIKRKYILSNKESIDFVNGCGNNTTIRGLKWFATLEEAEEFSKSLKVIKFEKGKWYKCKCNNNFYKFHSIKDNEYFVNDAVINNYPSQEKGIIGYIERMETKSLLEYFDPLNICTTKEIQQYLPENHPDKIKKMKKNYVYVKNQEEWDFVSKKLKYDLQFPIKDFINDKPCISLHSNSWSSYDAYNNNNYYTFKKWLDMNNYTEEYNNGKWAEIIETSNKFPEVGTIVHYQSIEGIVGCEGAQESVVSGDEIIINNEKELPLKTPKKNNKKIDIYVENISKISNSKNEILLTIKKRKKL